MIKDGKIQIPVSWVLVAMLVFALALAVGWRDSDTTTVEAVEVVEIAPENETASSQVAESYTLEVLMGESHITAVTYDPNTGLYCYETNEGEAVDCECRCEFFECNEDGEIVGLKTPITNTPTITSTVTATATTTINTATPTPTPGPTATPSEGETEETPTPTATPGEGEIEPTPTPGPTATPTQAAATNCNNGVRSPDCPPPGWDRDGNGVAECRVTGSGRIICHGDNDDDGEERECGGPGNPCNRH
jgi:hypothetical protein